MRKLAYLNIPFINKIKEGSVTRLYKIRGYNNKELFICRDPYNFFGLCKNDVLNPILLNT